MQCPLCHNQTSIFEQHKLTHKIYFTCSICKLVFLSSDFYLDADKEKKRYALHQNNIESKDYVEFLNRIIKPSLSYIDKTMHGLDYGCGPDSVLAKLLNLENINCDYYDPFFFPNPLAKKYDFIFATECFEHFFSPSKALETISSHLKSGGFLSIMTEFNTNTDKFLDWNYIKDPTHVCFYSLESFEYISQNFGFEMVYTDKTRCIILQKS
ncbi:MAG: class I SAM-dependent methyltransferase [Bacteroidales bacterium]|nr:class I SAM-dependent methyltransferase [Bacteroidales bacterium]